MTEPTPVTEDGDVIGTPPEAPPPAEEQEINLDPPPPLEPPAAPMLDSGAEDPVDL